MKRQHAAFGAAIILLAWLPIYVAPAIGAMWQWSKVASSNASADPTVNWREGQSPSSVNDSARAMMAAVAGYRDDISGALTTSGTSTNYTVTTNGNLSSPPNDGQMIAITVHVTNAANPTLVVDGGGTYGIQTSPGVFVSAGTLIAGTPYTLKFNVASLAWILRDYYGNPFSVPIGAMIPYVGTTAPNSNFIIPVGQQLSRTTYATLFGLCGTSFGAGDGSTTFNAPDMRGNVPAGTDDGLGRLTGFALGTQGGAQAHSITIAEMPAHQHTGTTSDDTPDHTHALPLNTAIVDTVDQGFAPGSGPIRGASFAPPSTGGASTRHHHTFTTDVNGSGNAMSLVQPTLGVKYILRVL